MARTRKTVYSRRYCNPPLLNDLLFRFKSLNPLTKLEFPMSTSRRNVIIRMVSTILGDIAVGIAMASVATWIIESAALGLFLSFLIWLLAAIAALALSQFLVHPTAKVLLSDQKLDLAVDAISGLADRITAFTRTVVQTA
jgi:hypothetical protein